MNYQFPVINNISDVLPAIEGCDEIRVFERGDYTVVNYVVVGPDTFPPMHTAGGSEAMRRRRAREKAIRRECRGLIFESGTGRIIRRPLHKFFNVNEREETLARHVDLAQPHHILTKLDGSSISPFLLDGALYWGTRMGCTDVADQAADWVLDRGANYIDFARMWCDDHTPIFEWCSPQQRIVVDHADDQLILLAMRNIYTGEYMSYELLQHAAQSFNIPVVQPLFEPGLAADHLVEKVRALPLDEYGEGVVVRFDDGHMVKIKSDEYCLIHKAKERITEERHVVADILNGDIDDVLARQTDEDRLRIEGYTRRFWKAVAQYVAELEVDIRVNLSQYPDRKSYALARTGDRDRYVERATFSFFENGNMSFSELSDYVVDNIIKPNLGSRIKFTTMKQKVFKDVSFKY